MGVDQWGDYQANHQKRWLSPHGGSFPWVILRPRILIQRPTCQHTSREKQKPLVTGARLETNSLPASWPPCAARWSWAAGQVQIGSDPPGSPQRQLRCRSRHPETGRHMSRVPCCHPPPVLAPTIYGHGSELQNPVPQVNIPIPTRIG